MMKLLRPYHFGTIFVFAVFGGLLYAAENYHVVRKGDVLSRIAQSRLGGKIYDPIQGALKKLLDANPDIRDANKIYVGQKVLIPTAQEEAKENASAVEPPPPQNQTEKAVETEIKTEVPGEEIPHSLLLSARYGYLTLGAEDRATGSDADLNSSIMGVGAAWRQRWSPKFSTFARVEIARVRFEQISSATKTLSGRDKTVSELALGGANRWSEKLELSYALSYGPQLFVRGVSSSLLTVDAVPLLQAAVAARYVFLKRGRTHLGVGAEGAYIGSGNAEDYSIDAGYALGASLSIERRFGDHDRKSAGLALVFRQRKQNTSVVDVTEDTVTATLTIGLPLFEGN